MVSFSAMENEPLERFAYAAFPPEGTAPRGIVVHFMGLGSQWQAREGDAPVDALRDELGPHAERDKRRAGAQRRGRGGVVGEAAGVRHHARPERLRGGAVHRKPREARDAEDDLRGRSGVGLHEHRRAREAGARLVVVDAEHGHALRERLRAVAQARGLAAVERDEDVAGLGREPLGRDDFARGGVEQNASAGTISPAAGSSRKS